MVDDKSIEGNAPEYSILLPTYNEAENLPICVWLINKYMNESYEVWLYIV